MDESDSESNWSDDEVVPDHEELSDPGETDPPLSPGQSSDDAPAEGAPQAAADPADQPWVQLDNDERFASSRSSSDGKAKLLFDAEGMEPVDFFY